MKKIANQLTQSVKGNENYRQDIRFLKANKIVKYSNKNKKDDEKMNFDKLQQLIEEVNEITNGAYDNIIKEEKETFWNSLEIRDEKPERIANMIHFGSYNPLDEFIGFDGYGNIESMDKHTYYNELKDYQTELLKEIEE
ncbi:hypothetical protein EXQLCQDZ_CDS0088 [Staphylococcus phage PG-2021_5]